jgi:prophage maintenance system killer protein
MKQDPFQEYYRAAEPDKVSKSYAWSTAIGLQAVDGLEPSPYLVDTALQNIEGKITLQEARELVESYYAACPTTPADGDRTEEADKVSARIAEILSEPAFSFVPNEYIAIHHLAVFISRLWQIHVFGEGNTRTTAVFFIKYLRTLGFSVINDSFAAHACYFRNALVRANYTNLQTGIHETTEYLERFHRNLLLNEQNPLHNRDLHI